MGEAFALKNVLRQTVSRIGRPEDIAAAVCFLASPLIARCLLDVAERGASEHLLDNRAIKNWA